MQLSIARYVFGTKKAKALFPKAWQMLEALLTDVRLVFIVKEKAGGSVFFDRATKNWYSKQESLANLNAPILIS